MLPLCQNASLTARAGAGSASLGRLVLGAERVKEPSLSQGQVSPLPVYK